jgi:hypothetical protein
MITPHLVVRGAARAAEWYAEALGAEERPSRSATRSGASATARSKTPSATAGALRNAFGPSRTQKSHEPPRSSLPNRNPSFEGSHAARGAETALSAERQGGPSRAPNPV